MTTESSLTPTSAHITSQSYLLPTINAWRYYLEDQGNSIHTIKAFTADLQLLASYLPQDRRLGEIATTDLNNFLDWMRHTRGVPCSPKTLSRRITSLKSFFRWLHQNAAISVDPAEKIVQKSVISPIPEVLAPDEEQAVLLAAEKHLLDEKSDARPMALLSLLLSTAIKKGECLGLTVNHIDLESQTEPFLFVRYASPQNRYKERKIILPETWIPIYQQYQSQYEIEDRVFPWSPRRLEYILEDLSVEASINKHLSFDMCRWTCALNDWNSEMDRNAIRQKLGVSKIQWREISMKLQRLSTGDTS
jgi:site-specific recombinase XerD